MMPGLSLKVSQNLTLTPQLQQSIRLLQLSTQELQQEVEQMLDENPFLERAEEDGDAPADVVANEPAAEQIASDFVADGARESSASTESDAEPMAEVGAEALPWDGDDGRDTASEDWGGDMPARGAGGDDEEYSALDHTHAHESLQDVLHRQALALRLSTEDRAALYFLIESLSDEGYLEDSLAELAQGLVDSADADALESVQHHLTVALRLLQSMEPVGVGARNLQECLVLQLKMMQRSALHLQQASAEALETALLVCHESLDLLARRDVRKLVQLTGCKEAAVREAMVLIAKLEPCPGRPYANVERNVVVPDVIVRPGTASRSGQPQWRVQLNPDVMPKLRVHEIYASALRGHKGGQGHAGMQQRLQEARWFIKNIQQRFDTILRVSQAIVERQKNFFVHGELAMRPMVLREIADELGLHESTISRVTTAKYMATPQGTFELKYFFGSGLGTETGGSASSTAVKALIKQLLDAENPNKPLSDSKIAELLQQQGIECARRTVAKYRETLRIPPANLRKTL